MWSQKPIIVHPVSCGTSGESSARTELYASRNLLYSSTSPSLERKLSRQCERCRLFIVICSRRHAKYRSGRGNLVEIGDDWIGLRCVHRRTFVSKPTCLEYNWVEHHLLRLSRR